MLHAKMFSLTTNERNKIKTIRTTFHFSIFAEIKKWLPIVCWNKDTVVSYVVSGFVTLFYR